MLGHGSLQGSQRVAVREASARAHRHVRASGFYRPRRIRQWVVSVMGRLVRVFPRGPQEHSESQVNAHRLVPSRPALEPAHSERTGGLGWALIPCVLLVAGLFFRR